MTAPMPKGTTLPSTMMPCLVPYFVTKFFPSTLLICSSFDAGTFATICLAQCGPVRSAILGMVSAPLPPSIFPMTRVRRRSISSSGIPWISASEKAKRAVSSSVERTSPPESASARSRADCRHGSHGANRYACSGQSASIHTLQGPDDLRRAWHQGAFAANGRCSSPPPIHEHAGLCRARCGQDCAFRGRWFAIIGHIVRHPHLLATGQCSNVPARCRKGLATARLDLLGGRYRFVDLHSAEALARLRLGSEGCITCRCLELGAGSEPRDGRSSP